MKKRENINVNTIIGYVMENGYYREKYYFNGTVDNITRFIMQFGKGKDVRIILTDTSDEFILSTYGEFIDEIQSDVYTHIIDELLELQMGKSYQELKFEKVEVGVMKLI